MKKARRLDTITMPSSKPDFLLFRRWCKAVQRPGGPPRLGPGRWLTASARRGQRLVALHAIPRRWAEEWGGLTPWGLRRSDACGRGTGAGATGAGNRGPDRTEDARLVGVQTAAPRPWGPLARAAIFLTSAKCGLHAKCLISG